MATTLHSFIDIFDFPFDDGKEIIKLQKIVIPIIQRDYAQGRRDRDVDRVRSRFLDSLYKAVTESPITLDFVYGDIDSNGIMTPLDGQQRLTTLFLLHWYAAKKDRAPDDEWQFLNNFSYETRYSARNFCRDLIQFTPQFGCALSEELRNQVWFPLDWEKDPTIASMLVMLDAIQEKFQDADHLWDALKKRAITFFFLPIREMGLTDELYIKMNSRGKPLTVFEHFKAELERGIRSLDEQTANRIAYKIDRKWTDLLWKYRNSGKGAYDDTIIDDEFLRYFKFICDVICYRQDDSPVGKSDDVFDLLQRYFSPQCADAQQNVETMEAFFDCWCDIPGFDSPSAFLESFMAHAHSAGKILIDAHVNLNVFADCLHAYSDKSGKLRLFPLNRVVLLYAITYYLQHSSEVSTDAFARRIRIVHNLIRNSEDEISDRTDRNRMPAILRQTDAIILTGQIDDSIDNSFNVAQLTEEKEKSRFLEQHPEMAETLYKLEDHTLLKGQIGILGLDHLDKLDQFTSLFACDFDRIDRAMMATGDYGQLERNNWRYQYGSTNQYAWHELFHKSARKRFDQTRAVLLSLLSRHAAFTDGILEQIIRDYIAECERKQYYPLRYYYVKYPVYRPGAFGKLSNTNEQDSPYLFSVMQTKSQWSQNTYMPFLKAADNAHLSKDDMGQKLIYGDEYIICTNDSFVRKKRGDNMPIDRIRIVQNEEGIDTEDKIVKLREYIKTTYGD